MQHLARPTGEKGQELEQAAQGKHALPAGDVNIGIVPVASRDLIAMLAGQLQAAWPGIRMRVREGYSGQVEEWLAEGRIDIAVFNRYRPGRVRNAEPLMHANMFLIAPRGHVAVSRPDITLRELKGVPLVFPLRPNRLVDFVIGLAASQHVDLNVVLEVSSTSLIREIVRTTGLCNLSPKRVFAHELDTGEFGAARVVRPIIAQTTWLALGSHRPASDAVRIVARLIRELLHKLSA